MEKEKQILIVFVLLIVGLVVGTNFDQFNFTGYGLRQGKDKVPATKVTIVESDAPNARELTGPVIRGEKVYAKIEPGEKCAEREVEIYENNVNYASKYTNTPRRKVSFKNTVGQARLDREGRVVTSSRYCEPVIVSYKTSKSWQAGRYFVRVFDLGSTQNVDAYFTMS